MPVIKNDSIQKIKDIIKKHHNYLMLIMAGKRYLSKEDLDRLGAEGINTKSERSILDYMYDHNFINEFGKPENPTSLEDVVKQQAQTGSRPQGEAHDISRDQLASNLAQAIEKLKIDVMSKFEGVIRDNNNNYKFNALQNLDRDESLDQLVKESTVGELKRRLRDLTKDANRDWSRVATTEVSNAIGLGSIDRIVNDNRGKDASDIYVYRITAGDAAVCKYCQKFYVDSDGTPKVYKLSTLLNNGSNYGKKAADWKPTSLATHPNERCSQIIELRPGWRVKKGGTVEYIGSEKWKDYIRNKVSD